MDDNYDQVYDDIHLSSNSSSIWSFRSVLRLLSVRAPNFNAPAAVLLLPSIDPPSSNRPFISRSIDRSIATHLVRVLERWDCWRFGLTMGLGSPVPCLEADGGSGWTLWCAVLSKCLFFTTSQVPIFTYNQPPLSLSPPTIHFLLNSLHVSLQITLSCWMAIEALHGVLAFGLDSGSFGYVPVDRECLCWG